MGNLYTVPYLKSYTKYIDGSYSVIYWDREGKREEEEQNKYYCFRKEISPRDKFGKIMGFIQYRRFVKDVLLK